MDASDFIIFDPRDVDLRRSPLRGLGEATHVLGAFNPGLTRLPNGNILLMVRIAEALKQNVQGDHVLSIRAAEGAFVLDRFPRVEINDKDPRAFLLTSQHSPTLILTSFSWLLPVELSADGARVIAAHYDRAIVPRATYQEYGIEDARISRIGDVWYMTVCSVSAERHCTTLYTSKNGLDYDLAGIVLDHQNKDMTLFEGKVSEKFTALTRPLGQHYLAYPHGSDYVSGPSIQLAQSPDALHWRPMERPCIRPRGSASSMKVGGGTPPILTRNGWLMLYHGVEVRGLIGIYRTFWAILDRDDPTRVLRIEDREPLLEARPELSRDLDPLRYLNHVVFTTGIAEHGKDYIIASGEDDLACRITRIPRSRFE
jgi:beta-1,2-mannobiose phosphorylase / 1,2-beta-oligomannan phosphorylase